MNNNQPQTKMTLSVKNMETIMRVLQKELAEVTIDPKQEYHLNWEHHTPRDYQKILFRAREELRRELEEAEEWFAEAEDRENIEEEIPGNDGGDYQKVDAYKLLFYIISDPSSEGGEKELPIYETPFFVTKEECIQHAVKNTPAVAWELFCYAEENPVNCYKPDYLDAAWTDHATATAAIQRWLILGLFDSESLMSEDKSDYCGHSKITEPQYNIDAYARWERAAIHLRKEVS
jgi:hypothetical protein